MKIALLTASISRQSGGLLGAVSSQALSLRDAGAAISVYSGLDKDTASDLHNWHGLDVQVMRSAGAKSFGYLPGLVRTLRNADPDLLHTHGLWMYPSVAGHHWQRASRRPLVVSTHGMLDPWALRNSGWKKRVAATLYENAHLGGAACLHALCESEYRAIRAYGLRNPVALIPNGVSLPDLTLGRHPAAWRAALPPDAKVLLFLGRIHPKKGLSSLLHAWAQARQADGTEAASWFLVIAGWDQGSHQRELATLANDLTVASSVHFVGPQFDQEKDATLASADAFVLPSLSEGLPMAVLEAWSHRLPVLMTPECNLPEGYAVDAAVKISPEVGSLSAGLMTLFTMSKTDRAAMGRRGCGLVEERFTWPRVAQQMMDVYRWLLDQGARPDCALLD